MKFTGSDEALIEDALKGSARAWDKLVRTYETRVYNYGLRLMGNRTDAMDLMQEVFLGVYRNLHRFRGEAKFSSWLFRIAHNKSIDMVRRKRPVSFGDLKKPDFEENDYEHYSDDSSDSPEELLLENESNRHIAEYLIALPWEQKLVVELKIFQSLTFDDIADIQNISVNTAKTRFYSALKKMKVLMEETHVL